MAKEKRDIEINSRADTLPLMGPDVRPWPVTPPPSPEECMKVYEKRKAGEFGKFLEDNLRLDYRFDKPEALQGFRMMGMGLWRMGHKFATGLLAEQGMEFINVEPPTGDPARQLTPFGREEYMLKDAANGTPCGLDFLHELRNARSVTLNVETKEGQEMYKNLAKQMDVIVEEYPPGYMDSLGLGYRHLSKLNPGLVYCWIGQIGPVGPHERPSQQARPVDAVAFRGLRQLLGVTTPASRRISAPGAARAATRCARVWRWMTTAPANRRRSPSWRPSTGGMSSAAAASSSRCTGAETLMDILDFDITWYGFNQSIKARTGAWDPNLNQYEWNPCRDGYMMIGGQTDRLWYRIGMCIERDFPSSGASSTKTRS